MAITTGDLITYSDLTALALTGIINSVVNKSTTWYNNTCPACFKPGYDSLKHTHTMTYTPYGGSATNIIRKFHVYSSSNFNYYFTDEATATSMITSNFNAFLTARGILTKTNPKKFVSTTGIINFFNNLAAYAQTQIVVVCGHESNDKYMCFNTSAANTLAVSDANIGSTAPTVSLSDTQAMITDANLTTGYSNLINIIANSAKSKEVRYTSGWTNS